MHASDSMMNRDRAKTRFVIILGYLNIYCLSNQLGILKTEAVFLFLACFLFDYDLRSQFVIMKRYKRKISIISIYIVL